MLLHDLLVKMGLASFGSMNLVSCFSYPFKKLKGKKKSNIFQSELSH